MRAWLVASTLGGVPSTVHALLTGGDVLRSTRAAATLLGGSRSGGPGSGSGSGGPGSGSGAAGLVRGAVAHLGVSAFWTVALALVDRRWPLDARRGAVAGAVIAVVDLEVVGRRFPAIRELGRTAQWADHVAFGALVGAVLGSTVDEVGGTRRSLARRRPGRVRAFPRCRAWR
ncbi:hypothetical protein F4560_002400 [Saccharothrix ecbatanensis]|uniref:Uncharacterized protein n=1 Tax=Saccharothrix ecbatanensis TaxID=1105145 RepID=A0A7W9M0C8_9PSEU|nr:hypothetical protein [Saccharothrix ecbatanensis]MBB5802632.1 hypothetical protein [Saccharothrix ecbatanensis]